MAGTVPASACSPYQAGPELDAWICKLRTDLARTTVRTISATGW